MKIVVRVLPVFLALVAGCGGQKPGGSAKAAEAQTVAEVEVVRATQAPANAVYTAQSTLAVEHEADLLAEEEGRLLQVLADQGQRVRRGQMLGRLDDAQLREQLDQNRAGLKAQQVRAREAEVLRQGAEVELQRQAELRKEGLGSLRDFDRARFNLEALRHEVETAGYELERAKHKVAEDELRLSRMELRAPFDGIVARRYARIGQMLLRNDKVLRVTELHPLLVHFTVPESVRRGVAPGAAVEVVPSGQTSSVPARVIRTSYVVDAASGSLDCTAKLVDPVLESLVPGMAVDVKVPGGAADSAIWIPASAVLRHSASEGDVYIVVGDRIRRRTVRLGNETSAGVQVLSGVSPGDQVALHPNEKLQDGMMIRARL